MSQKQPRIKLPAGSVDTHAHVFGPQDKYPLSPHRGYTPTEAPLDTLLAMHAAFGVDRLVLTQPSVYGTDNSAMLDAIASNPDRIRGVVAVGADVTDKALIEANPDRLIWGTDWPHVATYGFMPDDADLVDNPVNLYGF